MPRTISTSTRFTGSRRQVLIPVQLVGIPAGALWWTETPGAPGSIVSVKYIIEVVTTTAGDGVTVQPTINGTAIGGGLVTLTSANTDATPGYAGEVAGSDVTAGEADFDGDDEIGLIGVLNVGAFAEGAGFFQLIYDMHSRG